MFDGGVFLGRNPATDRALTAKQLIDKIESCHWRAIVSSYTGIFHDYRLGNEEVLALHENAPDRIVPAVSVSPVGWSPATQPGYLASLAKRGARVLLILTRPKYYSINLSSPVLRAAALEAYNAGMAVAFGIENIHQLAEFAALYRSFPGRILIRWMNGQGYCNVPEIIVAAGALPQALFDVSAVNHSGALRTLVNVIGADRLYLASGIPDSFESTSHYLLESSDISPEAKRLIRCGTLDALFEYTTPCKNTEDWRQHVDAAESIPKIDTHAHLGSWNLTDDFSDVAGFLAESRRFGVRKTIISSSLALNGDLVAGNDAVAKAIDTHNELYGYIVVNPLRIEESLKEIERYAAHPRFVGIKTIQDLYGFKLDDEHYRPIFEDSACRGLPLLAHFPGMEQAAQAHPDLQFIAAHSTWMRVKHLISFPNIWFDLCTSHNNPHESRLEKLADAVGDRMLYGSDGPLIAPAWTIAKIEESALSADQRNAIYYENARRLFKKLP